MVQLGSYLPTKYPSMSKSHMSSYCLAMDTHIIPQL